MSLVRKFATVGSATLGSRALGFVRETLMAAALGAGPMADAFYAAFRFPNLFRRLFAEGAFNAAFVPLFSREIENGGEEGARDFAEEVFGFLFTVLIAITIVMELAMPILVRTIIAPGFDDPQKISLTVRLAIVMFPYLGCMSLASMMAGILNSLQRYFAAAIAPVFLNLILIAVLGFSVGADIASPATARMMAWGVLVAGLVQLSIVTFAARRAGIHIGFRRPRMTPRVKRLLWLALPAAITGGITQINLVIGQMIASAKPGAIAVLQYADRVYQLPLGVVGIAVGVVLLPELSRALKGGYMREAGTIQNRSLEFALFLTLPAAGALLVMAPEIVRVLYERGAFEPQTTRAVASALAIFGLGLPAFVMIKVFTPGFFAREDTRTPMIFAGISVAVNVTLALTLFPRIAESGIATAETAAGWTNAALLATTLVRRGHWAGDRPFMRRIPRLLVATFVMMGVLYLATGYADQWLRPSTTVVVQIPALLGLVALAMAVYFGLAFSIGGADAGMIRRNLGRGRVREAGVD
ncbi:murein biosynthesis integral membrane protein MurJ [Pararhizobium mangrovi]|uniref:Probable lipid II flippase MurJ n=1 Tax=Pararhizobium mangrovi TaxID=2590452 RepID=A0A506U4F3_9HYPH|nr:murein biosynthesis integral membrane protein MurJ [Pararhizobium mangrovi]TPW28338.1 murein biosynthesis integral membrane protein MurJ [Pararhizobium mangrovi]